MEGRPRFVLKRVFALRDELTQRLTAAFPERSAVYLEDAAEQLFQRFKGTVPLSVLWQSIATILDPRTAIRDVAWSIAGGLTDLKAGVIVGPGRWPTKPYRYPVQVIGTRFRDTRFGQHVVVTFRTLAGPGCPTLLSARWTDTATAYYARHPKGFGLTPDRPTRYTQFRQLFGCRIHIETEPADGRPRVCRVAGSTSFCRHNQQVASLRLRSVFPCPRQYLHACHNCPVGITNCAAATHLSDWVVIMCPICGQRGWAESAQDSGCLTCLPRR